MSSLNRELWKIATRISPKLAKLDSANKDLVRRTFNSMFMRIIRTGISFVFAWLLARILGATGQGIYEQALNITIIASVIGRFGMDQAVTRFVAANASQNRWPQVAGVYRYAMLYAAGLSSIAVVVVYLLSPTLAMLFGDPNMVEPMRWMSFAILPYGLVMIQSYLLQGIERIEDSIFVQTLGIPIVNIPFLILLSGQFGVTGAAMSYLLSTCLIALLGYMLWNRYTPELKDVKAEYDRQELLRTSRPLLVTDLSSTLLGRMDVILLGVFSTSSAVGIYSAGKRISNLASSFLTATSFVAAPKFASMYAQGQLEKLGSLARNAARLTTLISIPYLIAFLLFPNQIMSIFGENYAEGGAVLALLAIGQFINSATGAVGYLLVMTGHEKLMRNITLSTSLLKVALLVLLIPPLGYIGAALATMIGDSARNLLAVVIVYQRLDIITIPIPQRLAERLTKSNLKAVSSEA
jgi:O-antigen/teichoic acid export membrane protein